ncbi:hypothetical protein [Steroidobacter cummioxidans]|uniref:hypothetical protein n=1 Tax=Steroidobacter cummioxidans TaxID=1803913 RepID=UPI001290725A|nr:hypothetical protein [Steroidobacter cummioxidans]
MTRYALRVYWILATIFILVALAVPRLRPVGIVGCVVLGAMLTWAVVQRLRAPADDAQPTVQQRGRPTSPAAALQVIAPDQVHVADMKMSGGGAPFELRGRIENTSDVQLKSVTLLVTRLDCFEGALDPTGCIVLWQDRHWIPIAIPPGATRDFSSSVWMRGTAPGVRGTLKDSFEVVGASGESPPPDTKADR